MFSYRISNPQPPITFSHTELSEENDLLIMGKKKANA